MVLQGTTKYDRLVAAMQTRRHLDGMQCELPLKLFIWIIELQQKIQAAAVFTELKKQSKDLMRKQLKDRKNAIKQNGRLLQQLNDHADGEQSPTANWASL